VPLVVAQPVVQAQQVGGRRGAAAAGINQGAHPLFFTQAQLTK